MSLRDKLGLNGPTLYLMDGSAFVFRSFYAFRDMTRSDGFPTNALYITTRLLLKLVREERPAHFAFVLDGKGPNFRHRLFPAYKANREAAPEALKRQFRHCKALCAALGLNVLAHHVLIRRLQSALSPQGRIVVTVSDTHFGDLRHKVLN